MGFTVDASKASVDGGRAAGPRDMAFPTPGIAKQQQILALLDEPAVGKIEDERAIERIEPPVEHIECFRVTKTGGFNASSEKAIAPPLKLFMVSSL